MTIDSPQHERTPRPRRGMKLWDSERLGAEKAGPLAYLCRAKARRATWPQVEHNCGTDRNCCAKLRVSAGLLRNGHGERSEHLLTAN